jgi:hypothetical protein
LLGQGVPLGTLDSTLHALDVMGIFNPQLLQMVLRWSPKQVQRMAESISPELRSSVRAALVMQRGQFGQVLERGARRQAEENVPDRYQKDGAIRQAGAACLLILGLSSAAKLAIRQSQQLNARP